jgi:hypothetical protein
MRTGTQAIIINRHTGITPETAEQIAAQMPDTAPGPYYISVMKGDGEWRAESGPYPKHADALALVEKARGICEQMDPRACWYSFGTVRIKDDCTDPGVLQRRGYNLALERATVIRRTFAASKHPKGSKEREELNCNVETSEFYPSHKYAVRRPFTMGDGSPHPTQPFTYKTYRTKEEAEGALEKEAA